MISKIFAAAIAAGLVAAPVAASAQTPSPKEQRDTIKNDKLTPDAKKNRAGQERGTVGAANPNNVGGANANSNGGRSGEGSPGGGPSGEGSPGGASK